MSGYINDTNPSTLGGGIPGGQPKGGLLGGESGVQGGGERGVDREVLRRVLNYNTSTFDSDQKAGPFRKANNVFNKEPVKDGSDFTKFKKLEAKNKTYNDSSFGGSNNGSFTFLNRVRS